MSSQREKAEALLRLHTPGEPLVLVNAWDAVSARVVAAAGAKAIASASWSIAAARGYADGENISREEMIDSVRIIANAVELPVSADLERGFGDARMTLESAIEAGAVGCNLEDSDANHELWPAEEHVAVVAAARAAGDAAGVPIVINARTDVWLSKTIPDEEKVVAALERGAAYLEAGADCIFVPFVRDLDAIAKLAKEMGGPISVIGGPGGPTLAEFARAGVARVSYGPGPQGVAMAALSRAAETLLAGGDPPADLGFRG
jgi:2-methylisocitrate lyase-like PEP mutase family enzyme